MNGKSLVGLQIPAEEVENVDDLVREGYYGCRSDAIRDIIRRGAAHLRSRHWFVNTERGDKK
ncbi:MAG: ribbon-helix-helix domain-containing protein [Halobacteriota archaeon]